MLGHLQRRQEGNTAGSMLITQAAIREGGRRQVVTSSSTNNEQSSHVYICQVIAVLASYYHVVEVLPQIVAPSVSTPGLQGTMYLVQYLDVILPVYKYSTGTGTTTPSTLLLVVPGTSRIVRV
jgi:hypothetical protein